MGFSFWIGIAVVFFILSLIYDYIKSKREKAEHELKRKNVVLEKSVESKNLKKPTPTFISSKKVEPVHVVKEECIDLPKIRFVLLANSFKEGGRCIAGVELDQYNNPIIDGGGIKWVRPISKTTHGQVPTNLVSNLRILDIIEMYVVGRPTEKNYQSENLYFKEDKIKVSGKFDRNKLDMLCQNKDVIFGNKGKAVSTEKISELDYSLLFIKVNKFEIVQKVYDDNPKPQTRLFFTYNKNNYDLPITDPDFLHNYQKNQTCYDLHKEFYLNLSLGVNHNNWYYKLVASIIYK